METTSPVMEYKCPCCGAGLVFSENAQKLSCGSCGNTFEIQAVREYNKALDETDDVEIDWEDPGTREWSEEDRETMQFYTCPSCGGEILADAHTAATFCPYCENPAILPGRLSGGWKPDAVLPFKTSREDAQKAFLNLCKGKPLLPKMFTQEQRIQKISGIYVPFWLYDCDTLADAKYRATRVRHWSDAHYHYTRTDHYMLTRSASASFRGIPMDGSSKLDNAIMESIEPFDYSQMVDFDTAYLSGFLADKYDVPVGDGRDRIRDRVGGTLDGLLMQSCMGYSSVTPTLKQLKVHHGKARYVLLPVWMLHTQYEGKIYTFAMNGQTGKMTGTLPICSKRRAAWFAGIAGSVAVLVSLFQWLPYLL